MAMPGEVKQLLRRAKSAKREIDSWDNDFECDTDAAFRSSVSSSLSSSEGPGQMPGNHYSHANYALRKSTPLSSLPSPIIQNFRNGSRLPTMDYLNSFRENEDDEDFSSNPLEATTRGINRLGLTGSNLPTPTSRETKNSKQYSDYDTLKNTSQDYDTTLTIQQKQQFQKPPKKSTINKWSEDLNDEIDDGDFGTATQPKNTLRARKGKLPEPTSSIIKGTFFSPPSDTTSKIPKRIMPPNNIAPPAGTITHLQHRKSKRHEPKKQPDCSMISEEDFEAGFDDLGPIEPENLNKFKEPPQSSQQDQFWDDDNLESTNESTTSRHDSINSSLFSHGASTNTESEVDGEDFLEGVVIPDAPIDFRKALKKRQDEAEAQERRVATFRSFSTGSDKQKYGTVGSNGSKHSLESDGKSWCENYDDDADDEMGLLQDMDIGEGDFMKQAHPHRNVKLKIPEHKHYPKKLSSLSKKSLLSLAPQTPASSKTTRVGFTEDSTNSRLTSSSSVTSEFARYERLRAKKSMPVLLSQTSHQFAEQEPRRLHHQFSVIGEDTFIQQQKQRKEVSTPSRKSKNTQAQGPLLRHVHSVAEINNRRRDFVTSSLKKKSSTAAMGSSVRFSRAHTGKILGDGTELDMLDDLQVDPSHELSFTVQPISSNKTLGRNHNGGTAKISLTDYIEKPAKDMRKSRHGGNTIVPQQSKSSVLGTSRKKTGHSAKGPRLIQQLSVPVSTTMKGYNEDMHFNVKTYRWEGNDEDLDRFENVNNGNGSNSNGNTTKTPGLIAFISSSAIKVVGDMVFDPAKMCWISIREGEDDDPFKDLDDDDLEYDVDVATLRSPKKNDSQLNLYSDNQRSPARNANSRTQHSTTLLSGRPSQFFSPGSSVQETNTTETGSSRTSSTSQQQQPGLHGDFTVGSEFDLSEDMIRKLMQGQERWAHKVRGWFPGEGYDTSYLQEIRRMVMKK